MRELHLLTTAMTLLSLLPSCCPCRRLETSLADSLRVETRVRCEVVHDTVWVALPRETERVVVRDTSSRLETSLAVSEARINPDGTLFHSLANRRTELPAAVERVTEVRDSIIWRERTVVQTVEIPQALNAWQRFRIQGFWVLLAVVAVLLRACVKNF